MENSEEFKFPHETKEAASEATEEEFVVDVIDDTPEEDRNREPMNENPEPDEEELASYSDRVKKRIHTLQRAYHEERRAKEQADRERQEAIKFANTVAEKNKQLLSRTQKDASLLRETWKSKTEVELASAKEAYKNAYETGDSDLIIEAQDKLNRAIMRHEVSISQQPALQEESSPVETTDSVYTAPAPDKNAIEWSKKNQWFGKDNLMTNLAYGVHQELISSGVHPQRDAVKYYEEIDKQMRKRFPDYNWGDTGLKEPRQKQGANVVASVTRTAASGKKISLTQTQVALAKRLNIPLQEYAKQVAALNGADNG